MRLTQTLFRAVQRPVLDRAITDGPALSSGIAIVRKVLKENPKPEGWRTNEIYELALKEPAPEGFHTALPVENIPVPPPNPSHPIRSKQFLKEVLAHMQGLKDIQMTREVRTREGSSTQTPVFVWKTMEKRTRTPRPVVERPPTVSQAVGGHEDWSHLSRRRLRARRAKILKMVHDLKGTEIQLVS
ncbi:hypothetical protein CC1G_05251 [Coprinopsis cinerea okayama7|uniref:Uncharacterized protein n=1 Tax=Coprinopsis cinerea (strain Okayama-7 / 130 / ATCC MYA-4618 / FGSC 9003) TaxID=240176 RepID=A8PCC8_COPC7|nr:hypothetical protein CC1G_05251 [Coprinopsis cinerea okayama7\|eukprot:XP_001840365.1 hypothetical protein CC1G_05251 [Coprinopsis cinerea okayama7\